MERYYSALLGYVVASMAVALALVLTLLLRSPLEPTLASLFFIAIVVSSQYCGLGPGLLAILLSALALDYFFIPPVYTFSIFAQWSNLLQIGVFVFAALMISSLAAARQQAEVALRSAHAELERRVQERTVELVKTNEALQTEVTNRKQAEQERNILYQLAHDLARSSDVNTVASHLFVRAKSLLKADYGWLMLANANDTELIGAAAYGMDTETFCQERIDLSQEIAPAAVAFLQKQPVVVANVARSPLVSERLRAAYHFVQSSCVAPLMKGEYAVGAFMVGYTSPRKVTPEELRLLQLLSDEAALAVERARLTDEVQRSEKRFRALIEQSTDAIALLAADSTLLYVSPSGSRMFGRSWEERIGRSVFELIHPEDLPSIKDRFAQLVREPDMTLSAQLRYQHQDGSWRWVEAVGQNLLAELSVRAIVVNYRDITERKRMEEALRQSEARYHTVSDLISDYVYAVRIEPDGRTVVEWVTEAFHRMTGFTVQELAAGGGIVRVIHPEDLPSVLQRLSMLLAGQPGISEHRIITKSGAIRWLRDYSCPEWDPIQNRVVRIIGAGQDITERQQVEEQLQDYTERLRFLSRRLLEMQESERRALARELHDEVGQVVTGLRLTLEASLRLPPEAARQRVETALTLARELTGQVRQLSLDLRPAMLDDLGLVPALEWLCERYTAQTQVMVACEQSGVTRRLPPMVETAAYRIVQEALTNVARHAGVSEVTVRLEADQAQLTIEIQDQGRGFESGTILTARTSSGLAGMQERVTLLGGHLTVESAPGSGTCVRAIFPLNSLYEATSSQEKNDE